MQWYKILIATPVIIVGAHIRGKIHEYKKNWFKNYNWKTVKDYRNGFVGLVHSV
jgi:hypothetical protein